MRTSIWKLCLTNRVIECFIEPTCETLHAVTVVLATDTLLEEIYPDSASARTRATQMRDNLVKSGGWTIPGPPPPGDCAPASGVGAP